MSRKIPEFAEPPAVLEDSVKLALKMPESISSNSSLEDVKSDDVNQVTNLLQLLYLSLGAARDIETICKISSTVTKLLVERRKLLCLQYGSRDTKGKGGGRTYTVPD